MLSNFEIIIKDSVVCRQDKIVIVNFRNWTRVDVWENENAVEIQDVDECLHSSFEFPQTFRHE